MNWSDICGRSWNKCHLAATGAFDNVPKTDVLALLSRNVLSIARPMVGCCRLRRGFFRSATACAMLTAPDPPKAPPARQGLKRRLTAL